MSPDKDHLEAIASRAEHLRQEVKRICNVTLRGVFKISADRDYWVERSKKLSGELAAIENLLRPMRLSKGRVK
jgi:hypothetical protein